MPVILHIEALGAGGDAIARLDGRAVFVPGGVPGDVVEAELVQDEGRSARARVARVLEPSPDRVEAGCAHAATCGGCPWMHLSLAAQERAKEDILRSALARVGGVEPVVRPIVRSPRALRYRQRATLHVAGKRLGYRAAGSHDLVEVGACPQLDERLEAGLLRLRAAMGRDGAPPKCSDVGLACDERKQTAAFFVAEQGKTSLERAQRLLEGAGLDAGVLVPEGRRGTPLGDPVLSFPAPHAPGVTLHGRADLFSQANAAANALLVGEALRLLGPAGPLLELYSGAGNFTFAAARAGFQVTAIESEPDSLELARRSAREAGLDRVRFLQGDALKAADGLARERRGFETLLLDPPRAGARGVAPVAQRIGARRIVYVSCDPASLARDVRDLVAASYELVEATPVDMFPQTFHLETVALLTRRE